MSSLFAKLPLRRASRNNPKPNEAPEAKLKHIYAPDPLPAKRKRTLTLPLPPPPCKSGFLSRTKQHTSLQDNCLFLQRLPYDVRRIIYNEILCGNILHFIRMRKRLRHLRCSIEDGEGRHLWQTCWGVLRVDERSIKDFYTEKRTTDGGIVPLMRTCRAIYTETTPLLYTHNTFDLNGLESILLLSYTILPHRFNSITSLRLTWAFFQSFQGGRAEAWRSPPGYAVLPRRKVLFPGDEATWKACWAVIAGMEGLRDLRVWLAMSPANNMPQALEEEMLSPLVKVGAKRIFKVRVSWALKDDGRTRAGEEIGPTREYERDEVPYEIIRQQDQDWGAGNLRLRSR